MGQTDSSRQRLLREGAQRGGEDRGMVEAGATPSPETDGEPRKTPRLKEEIGREGGAARVRPSGTQAQEAKATGCPASAPWWKGPKAGLAGADERGPGARLWEDWVEGVAGLVGAGRRTRTARGRQPWPGGKGPGKRGWGPTNV